MFDGQMEMSFARGGRVSSSRSRKSRARWWFDRMRHVVDRVTVWQPVPPPRPVQIWFPATDKARAEVPVLHSDANSRSAGASDSRN